jgi:hypothetical protein
MYLSPLPCLTASGAGRLREGKHEAQGRHRPDRKSSHGKDGRPHASRAQARSPRSLSAQVEGKCSYIFSAIYREREGGGERERERVHALHIPRFALRILHSTLHTLALSTLSTDTFQHFTHSTISTPHTLHLHSTPSTNHKARTNNKQDATSSKNLRPLPFQTHVGLCKPASAVAVAPQLTVNIAQDGGPTFMSVVSTQFSTFETRLR